MGDDQAAGRRYARVVVVDVAAVEWLAGAVVWCTRQAGSVMAHAGGRPTKLTRAVRERICDAVAKGMTYELAAQYGGIGERTFYDWMAQNPQFSQSVKAVEAQGVYACLAKIERAADDGNWQAAAWILERRYPRMYGRVVQEQQHSGRIEVEFVNDWRVASRGERGESEAE